MIYVKHAAIHIAQMIFIRMQISFILVECMILYTSSCNLGMHLQRKLLAQCSALLDVGFLMHMLYMCWLHGLFIIRYVVNRIKPSIYVLQFLY